MQEETRDEADWMDAERKRLLSWIAECMRLVLQISVG